MPFTFIIKMWSDCEDCCFLGLMLCGAVEVHQYFRLHFITFKEMVIPKEIDI